VKNDVDRSLYDRDIWKKIAMALGIAPPGDEARADA
jgi:hypothetical protein